MAMADGNGLPVSAWIAGGERAECQLVVDTLDLQFTEEAPEKLIGDRAYDSDKLDEQLTEEFGVELIAPIALSADALRMDKSCGATSAAGKWSVSSLN